MLGRIDARNPLARHWLNDRRLLWLYPLPEQAGGWDVYSLGGNSPLPGSYVGTPRFVTFFANNNFRWTDPPSGGPARAWNWVYDGSNGSLLVDEFQPPQDAALNRPLTIAVTVHLPDATCHGPFFKFGGQTGNSTGVGFGVGGGGDFDVGGGGDFDTDGNNLYWLQEAVAWNLVTTGIGTGTLRVVATTADQGSQGWQVYVNGRSYGSVPGNGTSDWRLSFGGYNSSSRFWSGGPMTNAAAWADHFDGQQVREEYALSLRHYPDVLNRPAPRTVVLLGGSAGPVSGSAATTVTPTGTAAGQALVQGQAAATVTPTGTAAGTAPVTGQAAATVTPTGTAAGAAPVVGQAAVTITPTGTAAGVVTNGPTAAAAVTVTPTGTAAGTVKVQGQADATVTPAGAAGGVTPVRATADATVTPTGTAAGTVATPGDVGAAVESFPVPARTRSFAVAARTRLYAVPRRAA